MSEPGETFVIRLTPQAAATVQKLAQFPTHRLFPAICRGLDAAIEEGMQTTLKTRFTGKGPFPVGDHRLGVRSGLLRTSFRRSAAKVDGSRVSAGLGSEVRYWMAHEFGFDGNVTVKAHERTNAINERGEVVRLSRAKRSKKPHTLRTSFVKAHTRHMRVPEREIHLALRHSAESRRHAQRCEHRRTGEQRLNVHLLKVAVGFAHS